MARDWYPVECRTMGDLHALISWFRSKNGPLYREWEVGTLGFEDEWGVIPFRRLLKLLDGSEHDVRRITIDDVPSTLREVRSMFRAYRRLRRAERRLSDAIRCGEFSR